MNFLIASENIKAGDFLINLGQIEEVNLFPFSNKVQIIITDGYCDSCAFYWYDYGTKLQIIRK